MKNNIWWGHRADKYVCLKEEFSDLPLWWEREKFTPLEFWQIKLMLFVLLGLSLCVHSTFLQILRKEMLWKDIMGEKLISIRRIKFL